MLTLPVASSEKELLAGIGLSRVLRGSQVPSSRGDRPLLQNGPYKDPQGSVRRPLLSGLSREIELVLVPLAFCEGRSHNGLSNW